MSPPFMNEQKRKKKMPATTTTKPKHNKNIGLYKIRLFVYLFINEMKRRKMKTKCVYCASRVWRWAKYSSSFICVRIFSNTTALYHISRMYEFNQFYNLLMFNCIWPIYKQTSWRKFSDDIKIHLAWTRQSNVKL